MSEDERQRQSTTEAEAAMMTYVINMKGQRSCIFLITKGGVGVGWKGGGGGKNNLY